MEKELRIGNLVYINGQVVEVVALDKEGINGSWSREGMHYDFSKFWQYDNTLNSISLTKEWLLNMGFVFNGVLSYIKDGWEITHRGGIFEFCILGEKINLGEMKSVHQLQNLYFALTGEEIKINQP